MNTKITTAGISLCTFLSSMALLAGQGWAQVKAVNGDQPKPGEPGNTAFIAWGVLIVFSLGILAIAFKTSKRNSAQRS